MSGPEPLDRVLDRARELGFLGPGPVVSHRRHAEAVMALVGPLVGPGLSGRCLDLGSGGGVPGLVIAVSQPESRWTLLDASLRRTEFLTSAVHELGLAARVEVVRARAEDLARDADYRERLALVTARSFGPPAVTAECAVAFTEPGGLVVVSEPPTRDPERWPTNGLSTLGLTLEHQDRWAVLRRTGPLADTWPRRVGVPAKRPLW